MKIFHLIRTDDQSGVSGTGHVAWACEFPHGAVAVTFRDDAPDGPGVRSYYWYDSMDDAVRIHGHGGRTRFVMVWGADDPSLIGDHYNRGANDALNGIWDACVSETDGWPESTHAELTQAMSPEDLEPHWAGYIDAARAVLGKAWLNPKETP